MLAEASRATGTVERGEELWPGQRERVRRPVVRLDEPESPELGRARKGPEVLGDDAGEIGVDHEDGLVRKLGEAGCDGAALTATGIDDVLGSEFPREVNGVGILGDEEGAVGRDTGGQDVAEHRQRELGAQVFWGVDPALAGQASERDDDWRHD